MQSLWLAISFKFSKLAAKFAINSFWCFLILNYGKTIGFDNVHAIHKRSSRTSQMKNQLYIPRFRTNRLQRSIKCRGVKVWNDIPNEIKNNKCTVADPENFGGRDLKHKTSKIRMSSPKLRVIFRPKSEIQTFFSRKFRWSPKKKKKGLHQN